MAWSLQQLRQLLCTGYTPSCQVASMPKAGFDPIARLGRHMVANRREGPPS